MWMVTYPGAWEGFGLDQVGRIVRIRYGNKEEDGKENWIMI